MRFADRLNYFLPGVDCPACGYGMPGPHARHCPVRAAALGAERHLKNEESRQALVRMLSSLKKTDWKKGGKPKGSE